MEYFYRTSTCSWLSLMFCNDLRGIDHSPIFAPISTPLHIHHHTCILHDTYIVLYMRLCGVCVRTYLMYMQPYTYITLYANIYVNEANFADHLKIWSFGVQFWQEYMHKFPHKFPLIKWTENYMNIAFQNKLKFSLWTSVKRPTEEGVRPLLFISCFKPSTVPITG